MRSPAEVWNRIGLGLLAVGIAAIPGVSKGQAVGPTGEPMPSTAELRANSSGARTSFGNNPFVPSSGSGSGFNSMASNPFANPYLNPYLNPMMTNQSMNPQNAALYFLAAQQAAGGIGSGRMSGGRIEQQPAGGLRTARNGVLGANANPQPPALPPRGSSNTPGAGASTYFDRGQFRTGGAARYYNRQGRHFPGNNR